MVKRGQQHTEEGGRRCTSAPAVPSMWGAPAGGWRQRCRPAAVVRVETKWGGLICFGLVLFWRKHLAGGKQNFRSAELPPQIKRSPPERLSTWTPTLLIPNPGCTRGAWPGRKGRDRGAGRGAETYTAVGVGGTCAVGRGRWAAGAVLLLIRQPPQRFHSLSTVQSPKSMQNQVPGVVVWGERGYLGKKVLYTRACAVLERIDK